MPRRRLKKIDRLLLQLMKRKGWNWLPRLPLDHPQPRQGK